MKLLKKMILRNIAGESILVPVGESASEFNGMISLTDSAAFIWKNLEKVGSLDEMVAKILDEFEVDEETARKDVLGFTGELVKYGFAAYTDEEKKW